MTARRRVAWGVGDQLLSSSTNFGLAIMVASSTSEREFGAFSLVFGLYVVVGGVAQALSGLPLSVKYSGASSSTFRVAAAGAAAMALSIGLLASLPCLLLAAVVPAIFSGPLAALGVVIPGLFLQETWRFSFVAQGKARAAAVNDAVWGLMQAVGTLTVTMAGVRSTAALILVWGGAATIAAIFGCVQAGLGPSLQGSRKWFRGERDLAVWYTIESLIIRGSSQLAYFLVAAVAGLESVGAIRAAQLLFSPLNPLFLAGLFVGTPEGVRLSRTSPRRLTGLAQGVSLATGGLALLWALIVLSVPSAVGEKILGSSWTSAKRLFFPTMAHYLGIALSMGAQLGLRALAAARWSVRCYAVNSVLMLAAASVGASRGGAPGAANSIALATALGTAFWWGSLYRKINGDTLPSAASRI